MVRGRLISSSNNTEPVVGSASSEGVAVGLPLSVGAVLVWRFL